MTSQELETNIRKGQIPKLCYLYGEESFLVERAARLLLDRAIDQSLKDFNFNVFYGNESRGIDIVDAAQTLPMFAERRAVLVKRSELLKAEALEILLPYVQKPAESTCLIFTGTKVDQRKKIFSEFKKQGALVEFKRLYDNKLSNFVQTEANLSGKPIEPAGADLLALLIGNNLQELSSQIEKLVVYAGSRQRITAEDVRTIASSSKAFTAFELARFLGIKDLQNALRSLETLFKNGEGVPPILGALSRHFRQLWRVREMLDQKNSQGDISRELGINTFFLGEYLQQAKNFGRGELRIIFDALYRCDVSSKSGGHPYTLMHALAVGICKGRFE
ncbi:DNA polymerase III subunit delta [Pelotalea chapellei]|uniref:DNA polymerase III subunit delta n=1 Tax=Pelotalea chapellei TaxID=44671 RepID=A0ABS5U7J6_9BACT|nr:DNA polymerase III subunit delta [Pelotalea chapellei]MBT1071640.1 DNA polymerase III subunit delta [Pelotalea chapellei]